MKKLILFFVMLILCASFINAYCNETQIITHTNQSQASSDYNITITRDCVSDDNSAGIAITLFILTVTGFLFILPFKKTFSRWEIADLTLKRGCWVVAIWLMSLNSGMLATIAQNSGLSLTNEFLDLYMWLFGWGGYLLMIFLVVKTIIDVILIYYLGKKNKRMGKDDE